MVTCVLVSEQLKVDGLRVTMPPPAPGVGLVKMMGVGTELPNRLPLWLGLALDEAFEPFIAKNPTATIAAMTRAPMRSMAGLIAVPAGAAPTGAPGGTAQGGGAGAIGAGGGTAAEAAAPDTVKPQAAQNLCPGVVRAAPQFAQKLGCVAM
jgi:hypothetical protein